eukprot:3508035-Alexandrium_andersonii.AAC.1
MQLHHGCQQQLPRTLCKPRLLNQLQQISDHKFVRFGCHACAGPPGMERLASSELDGPRQCWCHARTRRPA